MPTIAYIDGIRIEMRQKNKDHNPPHIHVFYGDFRASFEIKTCKLQKGLFPTIQTKIVVGFIEDHKKELLDMWNTQCFHKIGG